jgi:hypothetical protein
VFKFCSETYDWEIGRKVLESAKNLIPSTGENFVGNPDSNKTSPSFLLFVLVSLKEINDSDDEDACRVKLRDVIQISIEILKKSEISTLDDLLPIFSEEDDKLLQFAEFSIKILQKLEGISSVHNFMDCLFKTIDYDCNVILDWMTSDDETCLPLLRMLLWYLKVDKRSRLPQTSQVLEIMLDKLHKLQDKQLIPFDSRPLIRLLQETTSEENTTQIKV